MLTISQPANSSLEKKLVCFFSNQLETLLSLLQKNLFNSSSHPLKKRMVIVPDLTLKRYLLQKLTDTSSAKIVSGLEIVSLSQAMEQFLLADVEFAKKKEPSMQELSFCIEDQIKQIFAGWSNLSENERGLFSPLLAYFHLSEEEGKIIFTESRYGIRLPTLSDHVSHVFTQYGTFGSTFAKAWLEEKGWQQEIWKRIFSKESLWTYPSEFLASLTYPSFEIYLFHFSFIPKIYIEFFTKCDAVVYQLSPCSVFWEDFYSDSQSAFLLRSMQRQADAEEFTLHVSKQNRFLANMGKLDKKYFSQLSKDALSYDFYAPISSAANSLLSNLQNDLLAAKEKPLEKRGISEDASIQLHVATNRYRELEILRDRITDLLAKHQRDENPLTPEDVMVFAPDMSLYEPYLAMVFSEEESPFSYSIADGKRISQSSFLQGFQHLISLPKERFSKNAVEKLFSFTSFLEKFSLSQDDVSLLRKWVERLDIDWGLDDFQREEIFRKEYENDFTLPKREKMRTWKYALDQLLFGMGVIPGEGQVFYSENWPFPIAEVQMEKADLLGKLYRVILSLEEVLGPIYNDVEMKIEDWTRYLLSLAEKYFISSEEDFWFWSELENFAKTMQENCSSLFSFRSIERFLEKIFSKKNSSAPSFSLQGVRFSSLQMGKILPCKVFCIIGMSEEAFPRADKKDALLENDPGNPLDYFPSSTDIDRHLFLRAIISAQSYLYLSYSQISEKDGKELEPSLLILELFAYLDGSFSHPSKKSFFELMRKVHPSLSFDKLYFSLDGHVNSFSKTSFLAALSYYKENKKPPPPFLPEFFSHFTIKMAKDLLKPERKVTVDIATLSKFARHPCKFYFEKTLGFFLEEEKKGDNKEFFVSPLERSFLRKDSLHKPLERILENAKAKGSLPIGFFSEIAKNQVAQEVEKFRENLLSMEVKEEDIFKVCLKSSCKALFWQGKSLQMPAVVLKHDDVECTFVGDFAEVSSEGLLFHGEDSLEDLVKVWPLYLVFQNLPDSEFLPKRDLLLTKEGKRKSFHLADSKQALFSYLSYFALAQKHISPLFPKWADTLLLGEEKDFEKDVRSFQNPSSQTYKDRYMDWILTRDGLPDTRLVFQNWSSYLRDVFSSLLAMKKEGKR